MNIKTHLIIAPALLLAFMFVSVISAVSLSPATANASSHTGACPDSKLLGIIPSWDAYLQKDPAHACAIKNFDFPNDIWLIALAVLDAAIRLAAFVAGGYIIYGGYKLMTSQGNPEHINAGRSTITNAIIGLVIAVLATTIVSYIAGQF